MNALSPTETLKNLRRLYEEMRHCLVCRRRAALQEISYEESLMFLCNICFNRIEIEHACLEEHDACQEYEEMDQTPQSLAFLYKEKIK